ncbi:MAG: PEGA domain-containing protein [bacterium]
MKKFFQKIQKSKRLLLNISVWLIVIIGFVIVASFLIFRASGYAYNFKTGKIQKTGLLYVQTNPRSVDVFLEKEYKGSRTPLRVSYLLPGKYDLEIKKDGYKTISKTITIYEGLGTKIKDVLLLLESQNFDEIGPKKIIDFKIKDKNNCFVLYDNQGLNIGTLDMKDNKLKSIHQINDLNLKSRIIEPINSDHLIIKSEQKYYVLNWKTGNYYDLNQQLSIEKIDDLGINKNTIIIRSGDNLLSYNITNQQSAKIAENIVAFYLNSYIYAIQNVYDKNQILQINFNNYYIKTIEDKLDIASPSKLKVSKDKQFSILNKNNDLYIYDDRNLVLLDKQVQNFNWTNDRNWLEFGEKLALTYYTNNELWIYQKNNKDIFNQPEENYILRRLSHPINESNFFFNQYNIYFFSNNELTLSDLSGHATKITNIDIDTKYEFSKDYSELLLLKNGVLRFGSIR